MTPVIAGSNPARHLVMNRIKSMPIKFVVGVTTQERKMLLHIGRGNKTLTELRDLGFYLTSAERIADNLVRKGFLNCYTKKVSSEKSAPYRIVRPNFVYSYRLDAPSYYEKNTPPPNLIKVTPSEARLLILLKEEGYISLEEIAEKLGKDPVTTSIFIRSTIDNISSQFLPGLIVCREEGNTTLYSLYNYCTSSSIPVEVGGSWYRLKRYLTQWI